VSIQLLREGRGSSGQQQIMSESSNSEVVNGDGVDLHGSLFIGKKGDQGV
jgi:hypothetical protein